MNQRKVSVGVEPPNPQILCPLYKNYFFPLISLIALMIAMFTFPIWLIMALLNVNGFLKPYVTVVLSLGVLFFYAFMFVAIYLIIVAYFKQVDWSALSGDVNKLCQ